MVTYILLSVCCLLSLLNTVFIVLLSNSIFRVLAADRNRRRILVKENDEKGLVDLKNSATYDPRFLNVR
jgi:hypothetical protein